MNGNEFQTLAGRVEAHASVRPEQVAIEIESRPTRYADLDKLGHRVAGALVRDGMKPGDAIAVIASTRPEYAALMVGAARAGVTLVPLPVAAGDDALHAMIVDSGSRLIFTDMPAGGFGSCEIAFGSDFERWLAPDGAHQPHAPVAPAAAATIIYSSGTTGTPKGIVQSHDVRWRMLSSGAARGYASDTVTLLATPLYSNMTLGSMMGTLGAGGTVILLPKFDAGSWLATAARSRANHATLAPVMVQRLLAHPDFDAADLSAFGTWLCMSAPFSAALKAEVLRRWRGNLVELYGMTEGGPVCLLPVRDFPDKIGTVGRPAPGCEIKLIDELGREVEIGEQGEVVGRSGTMMTGYQNRDADTANSRWTAPDGSIWQRSGDIGSFDGDGFLTLHDRKKDMIISGGFNIYPADIEAVLEQCPGVVEASVVGVPSAEWGETPVAFVVAPGGDAGAVRGWVNARVGKMQRLAEVRLVDALPRGPIGKVLKRELRESYSAA